MNLLSPLGSRLDISLNMEFLRILKNGHFCWSGVSMVANAQKLVLMLP